MKFVALLKRAGIKPSWVAAELGITPSAISQWDRVPLERAPEVARITGIPKHELRPDYFCAEGVS